MTSTPGIDDAAVDAAIAAMATPVTRRPSLVDRLLAFGRELTNSAVRVALCAAWAASLLVCVVFSVLRPSRTVLTPLGTLHARCGLDAFIGGAPNRAVASACRDAEAIRLAMFVPAALIVVGGLVLAAVVGVRRSKRRESGAIARLLRSRVHAVLILLAALAVPVGLFALRPVTVERASAGGIVTAHCGADTYLFGYPERAIDTACHRAYASRAAALAGSVAVVALGVGAALHLALAERGIPRRRLVLLGLSAGSALVALAALRPVDVAVRSGAAPVTARCGIDTYVVGHPDATVQSACRTHLAKEAGALGAAAALALVAFAASRVEPPESRVGAHQRQCDRVAAGAPRPT